ncbi:hypothetical protein HDU76_007139, partial [Blyttiomyces sp. JEL0837]
MNRSNNRRGPPPRQTGNAPTTSRNISTGAKNTDRQQQQQSTQTRKNTGIGPDAAPTPALKTPIRSIIIDQRDRTQMGSSSTSTETSVKDFPPLPTKIRSVTVQTDRDNIAIENEKLKAELAAMKKLLAEKDQIIEELKGEVEELKRDVPKTAVPKKVSTPTVKTTFTESKKPSPPNIPTMTTTVQSQTNNAWTLLQERQQVSPLPTVTSSWPTGGMVHSPRQPNGTKVPTPKKGKPKFVPLAAFESTTTHNPPATVTDGHPSHVHHASQSPRRQQQHQQQNQQQRAQQRAQQRPGKNDGGEVRKQQETTVAENAAGVSTVQKSVDLQSNRF